MKEHLVSCLCNPRSDSTTEASAVIVNKPQEADVCSLPVHDAPATLLRRTVDESVHTQASDPGSMLSYSIHVDVYGCWAIIMVHLDG